MSKAGVAYSEFAGKSNKSADNGEQTESTKQSTISEFRQKPGIFSNCSGANQKNYTDKITGEDQQNIHESESPVSLDSDMKVKSSIAINAPFLEALQLNNCPYKKEGMCLPIAKLGIKYCLNEGGLAFIKGLTHLRKLRATIKRLCMMIIRRLSF
ncbi:MAG: hypothetical protein OXC48_12210 [Endozoicomonadaceae bacterium]|nr:hypothetical protein [Endozoicomonadaceae bacterium]